jgi:diketogulonate reductase-like aldo/keto reductase
MTPINDQPLPQLNQGTWNMGENAGKRREEIAALRRGIELGMTVIDTAEMYGDGKSETLAGEAIKGVRDQVFLVSKVLPSNASALGTVKACDASLKRLGVETLDLYLLHWRGRFPLKETLEGFRWVRKQGKIKAWGVSNFDVEDMEELFGLEAGAACAANQVLYNPEQRGIEFDLLPWCEQHGLAVMAYSPVGQGGALLRNQALNAIAKNHVVSSAQVALAWGMRKPVVAIPKSGSTRHVEGNARANNLKLGAEEELEAIDKAFPPPEESGRWRCCKPPAGPLLDFGHPGLRGLGHPSILRSMRSTARPFADPEDGKPLPTYHLATPIWLAPVREQHNLENSQEQEIQDRAIDR